MQPQSGINKGRLHYFLFFLDDTITPIAKRPWINIDLPFIVPMRNCRVAIYNQFDIQMETHFCKSLRRRYFVVPLKGNVLLV
jgi:hypothetical protein